MLINQAPTELKYIGRSISIKLLIDAIHEFELSQDDTIFLHPISFEGIILEYRDTYKESISFPFALLGVLIEEDRNNRVPRDRIGVLRES